MSTIKIEGVTMKCKWCFELMDSHMLGILDITDTVNRVNKWGMQDRCQ
jgi:hypothetical protein